MGLSNANITKLQLAKLLKKNYKPLKLKLLPTERPRQKRLLCSNKKIEKKDLPQKSPEFGIQELIKVYELNHYLKK